MIFSLGLKSSNSSNPIVLMAILMISESSIPNDLFCFFKKYLPASSMDFNGINPTSSDPVTLKPLSCAFLHTSSNTI